MTIFFAPFSLSHNYEGKKYSVATFQPSGFSYQQLIFLAPIDETGNRIRLSVFSDEHIEQFKKAVFLAYESRWSTIKKWLLSLSNDEDIVLCCWCPYSGSSKQQTKDHGCFICHSGLVAQIIKEHRPDLNIVMDKKYEKLYLPWHPFKEDLVRFEDVIF